MKTVGLYVFMHEQLYYRIIDLRVFFAQLRFISIIDTGNKITHFFYKNHSFFQSLAILKILTFWALYNSYIILK